MKGLQIRVPSKEMGELMKDLGATPVFMSSGGLCHGIEKKNRRWAGLYSPSAVQDNKLGGKGEVYYAGPEPWGSYARLCDYEQRLYNKLPTDLKAVIDKSCDFGKQETIQMWVEAWEDVKKYYKAEGVEIVICHRRNGPRWRRS